MRLRSVAEVVGEYPFCVGLSIWGGALGIFSVFTQPPSTSLGLLPRSLQIGWAVAVTVSAVATLLGLVMRRHSLLIVRALILFATTFVIYAIAIIATGGWRRGGAVAGLMVTYALVCVLRSRHLHRLFTEMYEGAEEEES